MLASLAVVLVAVAAAGRWFARWRPDDLVPHFVGPSDPGALPRGIQEDDDVQWDWRPAPPPEPDDVVTIADLERVEPHVRERQGH